MITPGEVASWAFSNLWIVAVILWVMVLFGVGGTIYSFLSWVNQGAKKMFNPLYLIILIILVGLTMFVASWIQGLISGWW